MTAGGTIVVGGGPSGPVGYYSARLSACASRTQPAHPGESSRGATAGWSSEWGAEGLEGSEHHFDEFDPYHKHQNLHHLQTTHARIIQLRQRVVST